MYYMHIIYKYICNIYSHTYIPIIQGVIVNSEYF